MDERTPDRFDALSRAAGPVIDDPPRGRTSVAELERRARQRSGRRRAAIATTAVVLVLGTAGLMSRAGTPDASLDTRGSTSSTLLLPHQEGDVSIFLEPGSSEASLDAVKAQLVDDPDVRRVLFVSEADRRVDMECLYAATPELLTAQGTVFAPNFLVYTDHDKAVTDRIIESFEASSPAPLKGTWYVRPEDRPPVPTFDPSEVQPGDYLVTGTSLDGDTGDTWPPEVPNVPDLSCPLVGDWIK